MPDSNLHRSSSSLDRDDLNVPRPRREAWAAVTVGRPGRYASRGMRRLARRRANRGIILVFVVVLLSLLAIMGTAYLATSRQDRQSIVSNTAAVGEVKPLLTDRTTLDRLLVGTKQRAMQTLIDDLFNLQPGQLRTMQGALTDDQKLLLLGSYRQVGLAASGSTRFNNAQAYAFYEDYDAPGPDDPFLASLLPIDQTKIGPLDANGNEAADNNKFGIIPGAGQRIRWPWISAPFMGEPRTPGPTGTGTPTDDGEVTYGADVAREVLPGIDVEPGFADPRSLTSGGFTTIWNGPAATLADTPQIRRADVLIGRIPMLRGNKAPGAQGDNTRVYPALLPTASASGTQPYLAGDADGDGIADCGLMPVVLNPRVEANDVNRYLDAANGVVYFVGYRIVDNSAKVNMSTALSVQGDFAGDDVFAIKANNNAQNYVDNHDSATDRRGASTDPAGVADGELRNAIALEDAPGFGFANMPNLGFSASNVGLVELFREQMRPFSDTAVNDLAQPNVRGLQDLLDARFPLVAKTPPADPQSVQRMVAEHDPDRATNPSQTPGVRTPTLWNGTRDAPAATTGTQFTFLNLGDMLQQTVTRRTYDPAGVFWYDTAGRSQVNKDGFKVLPVGDAASLAKLNGALLDSRTTPAAGEAALALSLQMAAPNYSGGGSQPWSYFPPTDVGVQMWFSWTQNFEVSPDVFGTPNVAESNVGMLDGSLGYSTGTPSTPMDPKDDPARVFSFTPGGNGWADSIMPMSIRTLLTTYSGVTSNVPRRFTYDALLKTISLPDGMPVYDPNLPDNNGLTFPVFPAVKASAATSTKEELWRAYWSVMTHMESSVVGGVYSFSWDVDRPTGAPNYNAFLPSDRHASDVSVPAAGPNVPAHRLSEQSMALIRSAVAACNTIDLRDDDNDITAMTIPINGTLLNPNPITNQEPMFARVYGTEKQLVISSVVIDADAGGGQIPSIFVEIYNPTDEPIDLRAYRLGMVDRSATAGETLGTGTIKFSADLAQMIELCDPAAPNTEPRRFLQPGGFLVLSSRSEPPSDNAVPGVVSPGAEVVTPTAGATQILFRYDGDVTTKRTAPLGDAIRPGNTTPLTHELVLARTRRADGEPSTEDAATLADKTKVKVLRPAFSEGPIADPVTDRENFLTLVPIDAVDMRSLSFPAFPNGGTASGSGQRYVYQRQVSQRKDFRDSVPNPTAWKEFYAGKGYEMRPPDITGGPQPLPQQPVPTDPPMTAGQRHGWAWRQFPEAAGNSDPAARAAQVVLGDPAFRGGSGAGAVLSTDYDPYDPGGPAPLPAHPSQPLVAGAWGRIYPFNAPTIPIQNFRPTTDAGIAGVTPVAPIDYLPTKFPYGSPFARDGDLLAVPYIGTYKIYHFPSTWNASTAVNYLTPSPATGDAVLYEYVPLTMDAVAVAPEITAAGGREVDVNNASVGRFDARSTVAPGNVPASNAWADDLFTFVTARQTPWRKSFPDVPRNEVQTAGAPFNDPTNPLTDQDGPVVGIDLMPRMASYLAQASTDPWPNPGDPAVRVPWLQWSDAPNATPTHPTSTARRQGLLDTEDLANVAPKTFDVIKYQSEVVNSMTGERSLIPGTINVNTAPTVVQRMLPFAVDPLTGFCTTPNGSGQIGTAQVDQRVRAAAAERKLREERAGLPAVTDLGQPGHVGIESLFELNTLPGFPGSLDGASLAIAVNSGVAQQGFSTIPSGSVTVPPPKTLADVHANLGDLQPFYRAVPELDFTAINRDLTRISNLASTRSDVFTVYVTVQAWTWTGANQATDTRLVGERRGAYIVDRSRIRVNETFDTTDSTTILNATTITGFKTSDLIVIPVSED